MEISFRILVFDVTRKKCLIQQRAVPFGLSFAIADLILMLLEREAHPTAALGILVQLSACRPASQSIRTSASTTTMRILRNEYM
ncbi:MAG: hypothetical protein WA728_23910, partial [Xanthobacteraceae bacterium]